MWSRNNISEPEIQNDLRKQYWPLTSLSTLLALGILDINNSPRIVMHSVFKQGFCRKHGWLTSHSIRRHFGLLLLTSLPVAALITLNPLPVCLPQFHIPFLLLPVSKRMSSPSRPHSLGRQVSQGFGVSSLTEARPGSTLQYVYKEPQTISSMLSGCWLSVWEILRVQVSWECWSSYGVASSLSSFSISGIQPQGSPASVQWLGVSICIYLIRLLVGPLKGQLW